jgi:hypothetical protein
MRQLKFVITGHSILTFPEKMTKLICVPGVLFQEERAEIPEVPGNPSNLIRIIPAKGG